MTVAIYEREDGFCQNCFAVKRTLTRLGVPYEVRPLTDDVAAEFYADGHRAVPIVVYGGRAHSGFKPTVLEQIARDHHYFED